MATPQYERFQLASASLDEGTVLLEASAGTGKTYALTGILVRMILEGVVKQVEQALVVTFTVAAADELKNRLRSALQRAHQVCLGGQDDDPFFQGLSSFGKQGADRLRRALDEFDQASVMTIHGFCKRLLDESAFESNEPFELDFSIDELPLLQSAAADALRLVREHDSPMLGAVLHEAKIDPDRLVGLYRNWQRYSCVALDPAEPQLGVRLANLRAAVHSAAAQWDDELLNYVSGFRWPGGKFRNASVAFDYFTQLSSQLKTQTELCVSNFSSLSITRLRADLPKREFPDLDQPFFITCEEVHAAMLLTIDHLKIDLMLRMHERLQRIKREQSVLTFDDLLGRTHAAITDPARKESILLSLQQRYAVALIDEFQDTDDRQYGILSEAFKHRPLFLVGDPKQSIYSFRGADLRTYVSAVNDAVQKNTLQVNYRSSPPLVAAVNQLFARNGSFVDPGIRMQKVRANAKEGTLAIEDDDGAAMRFRFLQHEVNAKGVAVNITKDESRSRIARDVTAEIQRLLDGPARIEGRRILPRHIAVLTRKNEEAVVIQEHLRSAGIGSVIGKSGDVLKTEEVIELKQLLTAIYRPSDVMCVRAAMATRIWGYDAEELAELDLDEAQFEQVLNSLERWRQIWIHKGFVVMKEQMLQDLKVDARLLALSDGERRLTNLQQLCELLHQAEHDHRMSPEALLNWITHELMHSDITSNPSRELRLESDEEAVQILTIHGSKGLQYEIVFCPFMMSGMKAGTADIALDDHREESAEGARRFAFNVDTGDPAWLQAEADALAENCRIVYVALTRAKRRCYVYWGPVGDNQRGYWRSALAWILQPDAVDQNKEDWPVTWPVKFKERSGSLLPDLQRIAANSDGSIGVDIIGDVPHSSVLATPKELADQGSSSRSPDRAKQVAPTLHRRRQSRAPLVVHSFSSIVAGSAPGTDAQEVRDPAKANDEVGVGIFGFARGAVAGLCLHEVLEHVDLQKLHLQSSRDLIDRVLARHGLFEKSAHPGELDPPADVLQNLQAMAAAQIHPNGPTVADVCSSAQIAEWKFTMPVQAPDFVKLGHIFAASDCSVAKGYADRLQQLSTQRCSGFLTGFADLITESDGRYWIVDWKSNHLGNQPSDYGQPEMLQAMHAHDYVLQYHLYVLAWHRFLKTRLADYDYDTHFGGVSYAFMRGAVAGESTGMFFARPPSDLVAAMDLWAGGNEQ